MNLAWTASIPMLAVMGMEIRQISLEQVSRVLVIVYCILGSLAALKYLLQRGRYSARRRITPPEPGAHERRKPQAPADTAVPIQPDPEPEDPWLMPQNPLPDLYAGVRQEPPTAPARPEPVCDLPPYPSRSGIKGIYEVESPGFTRSADYGLRLKPAPDGPLLSCTLDRELVCVYLRRGLTDVGVNLRRQGFQDVFDLLDDQGRPLEDYPSGRLRLVNVVPAICKDLGTALQLVEKGQLKVTAKE